MRGFHDTLTADSEGYPDEIFQKNFSAQGGCTAVSGKKSPTEKYGAESVSLSQSRLQGMI